MQAKTKRETRKSDETDRRIWQAQVKAWRNSGYPIRLNHMAACAIYSKITDCRNL